MKAFFISAVGFCSFFFGSCVTQDEQARGPQSNVSTQPWAGPIEGEGGASFGGALERR